MTAGEPLPRLPFLRRLWRGFSTPILAAAFALLVGLSGFLIGRVTSGPHPHDATLVFVAIGGLLLAITSLGGVVGVLLRAGLQAIRAVPDQEHAGDVHDPPLLLLPDLRAAIRSTRALSTRLRVIEDWARRAMEAEKVARQGTSRVLTEITRADETVRGKLTGELHDTVAQSLSMALSELRNGDPSIEEVEEHVIEAEEQLRALLAAESPVHVGGGLSGPLGVAIADLERRYGNTRVHVTEWPEDQIELTTATATLLYRFYVEAMRNAVRHGAADKIELSLRRQGGQLVATVGDDGEGFGPVRVKEAGRHVGLTLLAERAAALNGRLERGRSRMGGAQVVLELPDPLLDGPTLRVVRDGVPALPSRATDPVLPQDIVEIAGNPVDAAIAALPRTRLPS